MKWYENRLIWGLLLVIGGIVFLLDNLNVVSLGNLIWAMIFGVAGIAFLAVFISNRTNWWPVIPGMVLLAIGALIATEILIPSFADLFGGALILGGIALAFWIIYLINNGNWWAIIPAGVMSTLTIMVCLEPFTKGIDLGGLLFIGLGATFGLVAILPNPTEQKKWAYIPAGILLGVGVLISAFSSTFFAYAWPIILILVGIFLIFRNMKFRSE